MTHMNNADIKVLFGTTAPQVYPQQPFADVTVDFFDAWSKAIRQDKQAKLYPDIIAFAFWIRKANLEKMKGKNGILHTRIGRGMVFHIAPSNVAINFAYTFAFGLLTGNANIVRVSSKHFLQTEIVCRILKEVVVRDSFHWVEERNGIVQYGRKQEEWSQKFSGICNMRIIWGGDRTVQEIRKYPLMPRSNEITFADRYSFAILSAEAVLDLPAQEKRRLAEGFYNDTYLMDQNACSSPHLVCWLGQETAVQKAKDLFWEAVYEVSKKYDLANMKVSEKYTLVCEYAAKSKVSAIKNYENYLYVAELKDLPKDISDMRGKYGLFFEYAIHGIPEVLKRVTAKVQTCAVFGIREGEVAEMLLEYPAQGIDRIVPIGRTLDMDIVWDGHDLIRELSRCISYGK